MIRAWDIVAIGNLSRNRYWGEGDERAVRPASCTSTLISGDGFRLLVDPSSADPRHMAEELDRRTGLTPAQVDAVFVTHDHADHHEGLPCFPGAAWLAAPGVAEAVNAASRYPRRVEASTGSLFDGISVIATPGHTPDHHSLLFECEGLAVVVAGDSVMTKRFWQNRQGYWNSWSHEAASETMRELADIADIIVPGHDNYFLTRRKG